MSTTSIDRGSADSAEPPRWEGAGLPDLAHYRLQQLQTDGEFLLVRGRYEGRGETSRQSILVRTPIAERPAPATIRKMQNEYALRLELDPAYVARPLSLVQARGHATLILEDPSGTPLDLLLDRGMQIAQFLRVAITVAAALGHVHSRGLVHKDIKPANILVSTALDQAWLTGLGIASRLPRERPSAQPPEFAAGTLAYMAPEQTGRMNRSIDSRSDLYSLGVTFYQMLSGSLPFTATDPIEWVHCHIARKPVPPVARSGTIPAPISQIVMKLLAKTAEERYQTAAGVESDLRRCLAQWEHQGRIDPFALGQHDASDRLLIPEKLYGRAREVETLLACFDRVVTSGAPELVLVRGYSGIGKSSVVNELHRALVPTRGRFASGKFDQYKRDIPYSTLMQALRSLVLPLLGKSDTELSSWRDDLVAALEPNARLMIDLVPELKLIIGEQAPVPDLPPQQAQSRFQLVLRRFIGVFAQPEHPLALFLDDLQWLDSATLDLLEDLLTRSDLQHFILIGAYRDNEVDVAHPLTRKLESIRDAGVKIEEITLAPLTRETLGQMLADALRCERERAAPLADLVHTKTSGNPFFTIQFLSSLAEEGLLSFDHEARRWGWDLEGIHAKRYTDNVVELLLGKLVRLPAETQKALQQLACVGNTAAVGLLSIAFGTSEEQVDSDLEAAINLELVERLEGAYRFAHDRVQEAAYALIPERLRAPSHLQIGRLLAEQTPLEHQQQTIFEIVNQLNRGAGLISEREELERVAKLNLIAGTRAKASIAYASACTYLRTGLTLLGDDGWTSQYQLAFNSRLELAECQYLSGNFDEAGLLVAELLSRAVSKLDKAAAYRLKIDLCGMKSENPAAVESALECVQLFGIELPAHPTREQFEIEYQKVSSNLCGRSIESLSDLPLMADPEMCAVMQVLSVLFAPALNTDINLAHLSVCHMVNLTLKYGTAGASTPAYAFFGLILRTRFNRYADSYRFGRLACDLVERHDLLAHKAKTYIAMEMIALWTQPPGAAIEYNQKAFQAAVETGDLHMACYSCSHAVTDLLLRGDHLDEVWQESERSVDFARRAKFHDVVDAIVAQQRFIENMRGRTAHFSTFSGATFDEDSFERQLTEDQTATMLPRYWIYWILKIQARFRSGDYAAALVAAQKAKPLMWVSNTHIRLLDYCYYTALAIAAVYETLPPAEQAERRESLTEHLNQLREWAENCPATFSDRHALVAAEAARLDGRELDAERLYEEAIRSARTNGFVQSEALAYELAARFYATRGFDEFARVYLRHARDRYLSWGALGKVRQLEELHPYLREHALGAGPTSAIAASLEHLDLATVINASQAVSGEVILDRLLERLMRTAIEHAGAERGLLIARRGNELQIQAQATTSGADVTVHLRDRDHTEAVLPQSLVRHVMRTRDTVILEDASAQNLFSTDLYLVQHRVRSILCMPLINQSNLIGVLYLENNLVPRVFGPARIAVLNLLASQAAMALENTQLYRDLAEREVKFRRLFDANIVGISIWDLDGRVLEANDAFLGIVGYERDDLVSGQLRWTDFAPSQRPGGGREEMVAQLESGESLPPFEWEFIRKDGSRVPVVTGAALLEGGKQGVGFAVDLTERKRVEQALKRSEAYLAEAQRLTHTGSWAFNDARGQYTYFSDEQFRIYGLEPEPAHLPERKVIVKRFHPEDRGRVLDLIDQMVRAKRAYTVDYRIVLPDGAVKHLHSTSHPVMDERGELVEQFGTVADVTDRTRAEKRLLMETRVTRVLSEASSLNEAMPKILQAICESQGWHLSALWQLDRQEMVLRCTGLWCAPSVSAAEFEAVTRTSVFGCSGVGLPGRVWARGETAYIHDVTRDPDFPRAEAAAQAGFRGAIGFPILLGGEVLGVIESFTRDLWQPDRDLVASLSAIGGQIGQFMKRTAADEELQLRVNMLQQIPVAAWSVTPDGTPDIVNRLWFEYTGQTPEYVNSHPEAWMATIHPEDRERASQVYWEGIRAGHGFTVEARILRASDGTYRWHLNRAVPVRDSQGNILRFVGTSTDVHDWRQVQDELRDTQAEFARITRVMTMGELTASIAHEVNQPLGAMVTSAASCARWLAAKPPQMDKARRALERIVNDGRRAGAIIQRIRALMKRQTPRRDWLDVNETILEVIALAHYQLRRNDIVLETRLAEGLPRVPGDKVQCQQVLLNLIVNAVEAMSEIEQQRRELSIVSAADGPDAVRVEVRDTGPGLDPDRASQLFEPFYTTKAEGLGIGLSISRSIVEAHGGRLTAGPNAPHGAVFCIWLPVKEQMP